MLASASDDETVRLYSAPGGETLARLEGHSINVLSVCFSPDGRTVASGAGDKCIRLWSTECSKTAAPLPLGHSKRVTECALSPDSSLVATGSHDNTARLWRAATGEPVYTFKVRVGGRPWDDACRTPVKEGTRATPTLALPSLMAPRLTLQPVLL